MKKIALEEHFMAPGLDKYAADFETKLTADCYTNYLKRIAELAELRIEAMDKAGIELSVLSQTSPGLHAEKDTQAAVKKAIEVNDFLAAEVQKRPTRFAGFAHLAMHDPQAAVQELQRCVKDLGFKGAMVNGHTNGVYLDDERYIPFWETLSELGVPLYLHPTDMYDKPHMFSGYPVLTGAVLGWTFETATHAMRLIVSGLFDRIPNVKVILGHMGETLPFLLWRLDSRWALYRHEKELNKLLSQYIKDNFVITTSGLCSNEALVCSVQALGADNVLFSTDYPYESTPLAGEFIEKAPLSDADREKICYKNAQRILKLA